MTRPYSEDLRERALARFAAGETIREIGKALGIDPSCVPKWAKRKRETGSISPAPIGGRKPRMLSGEIIVWLRERLQSGPFTTRGLTCELAQRGIKTDRWKARQANIDPARLVFIDETWVKTNMTPLRGWGPKGRRLVAKAPHGHWKTMTFIATLRCDRIDAALVIDGPINGESFAAYVEQVLVPTLEKDDIVVLDNLGSHKRAAIRRMIRAAGARVCSCPLQP
jgi:transposase